MTKYGFWVLCASLALSFGCSKKDQDSAMSDGRKVVSAVDDGAHSVRQQVDRVQAALNVQKLKKELDDQVKAAIKAKDHAVETFDDARKRLEETNAQYQKLQERLSDAQKTLDQVTKSVQTGVKSAEKATGI